MHIDLSQTGLSSVRWTPGLRRVISFGDNPTPLADEVIDLLRRQLDNLPAAGEIPAHDFEPGETVRITAGPFEDMLAIFEGPTTPAERVRVLLNILGHASRTEIEADQLAKAPPDAPDPQPQPRRRRRTRGQGRRINYQNNN